MKEVTETRYLGDDGRTYSTAAGAADANYEGPRVRFVQQFERQAFERNAAVTLHGSPDEVDKALDKLFVQLRTLRGLNHARRLHNHR